jgi:hypothetical protein
MSRRALSREEMLARIGREGERCLRRENLALVVVAVELVNRRDACCFCRKSLRSFLDEIVRARDI